MPVGRMEIFYSHFDQVWIALQIVRQKKTKPKEGVLNEDCLCLFSSISVVALLPLSSFGIVWIYLYWGGIWHVSEEVCWLTISRKIISWCVKPPHIGRSPWMTWAVYFFTPLICPSFLDSTNASNRYNTSVLLTFWIVEVGELSCHMKKEGWNASSEISWRTSFRCTLWCGKTVLIRESFL